MNFWICLTSICLLSISQIDTKIWPCTSERCPRKISITHGYHAKDVVNSESSIDVYLNEEVPEQVNITVLIYSEPGLIKFDKGWDPSGISAITDTNATITFLAYMSGYIAVDFHTTGVAGHAELVFQVIQESQSEYHIDDSAAYISVNIRKNENLDIVISIVGWMYFVAWSLTFYFQLILNYRRKSVIGLNFDLLALDLLGFACYSISNFALLFSRDVRKDYYERNTYRRIPVEYNDLFFALHALLLTSLTVVQCFIYGRGEQKVSTAAKSPILIASIIGIGLFVTNSFRGLTILDVILYLSCVKLTITIIKYTSQANMNYVRKATTGWSIQIILLDFTGGVLSIAQMFFLAYNYDNWQSIFSNFTKFGLGVISILFDIIFVLQYYILYRQNNEQLKASGETISEPVISRSIGSVSRTPSDEEQ